MFSCENKAVFDVKCMHNPQYLTLHLCRGVKPPQISEGLRLWSSVVNSPTAPVCHSRHRRSAWIAVSDVCLLLWYTRLHHCNCLLPEDMFVTLSRCASMFWGCSVRIFFPVPSSCLFQFRVHSGLSTYCGRRPFSCCFLCLCRHKKQQEQMIPSVPHLWFFLLAKCYNQINLLNRIHLRVIRLVFFVFFSTVFIIKVFFSPSINK